MIVAETIIHNKNIIEYSPFEEPVVLQLGGSDPSQMLAASQYVHQLGFKYINLNCGCPSDRVMGRGCFGAALMKNADLVKDLTDKISESGAEVSIKHRLGIDDFDSYEFIKDFIERTSVNQCKRYIIHSRKCVTGLNPKQNRNIPPLMYDRTIMLKNEKCFEELTFDINGGLTH